MSHNLISPDYKEQCYELHRKSEGWGVASLAQAPLLAQLINKLGVTKVLDYGAGKCRLGKALQQAGITQSVTMTYYDPGVPADYGVEDITVPPLPHELVACIDVLEHIEPDYIDVVLDDLKRVTEQYGFFTIACAKAMKTLPDGRNAHILIQPPWWWLEKLSERFKIHQFNGNADHFVVFVKPL